DPRDLLVTRGAGGLADLPPGARVGTSSLRRRALLLAARVDLTVLPMRGNVDTRLRRLDGGDCDAIVLAAAGLARLGRTPPHAWPLEPEEFVPAVGQGILGVEARAGDGAALAAAAALDDPDTRPCAVAARASIDTRPLAGRRVVITRAAAQASAFARLLSAAGADVLEAPTIAIGPPDSWGPLDAALERLRTYQWVVFTSVNGVAMVGARLADRGLGWTALAGARAAAIGPATAAALEACGVRADVVPEEYRAEGLVEHLRELVRPGDAVLLPRAAQARDVLVTELARLGARVSEVPVYRTRPVAEAAARLRAALERGEVDVVTFTSSSTAQSFAALFTDEERARLLAGVTIASIGPITAATAASFGLATRVMPDEYTIPALARAIVAHFSSRAERSG